eukprot:m51a1_g8624 hypothetical protein (336) ;mRNA; r:87542-89318
MWSAEASRFALVATPSLAYNNLTFDHNSYLAFSHLSEVVVVGSSALRCDASEAVQIRATIGAAAGERERESASSHVASLRWVATPRADLLVATTPSSIEMLSIEKNEIECKMSFPLTEKPVSPMRQRHARGATMIRSDGSCLILVGTSTGVVHVFLVDDSNAVSVHSSLQSPCGAIRDLATCSQRSYRWACADDVGSVVVYDNLDQVSVFAGTGVPCTAVAMREEGVVVAAMANGTLRVYSLLDMACVAEINAHAREITAMHLHPRVAMYATVSEDSYIRVWSIESPEHIKLVHSAHVPHAMLTGVQFCKTGKGYVIAATAYDSSELRVLALQST